MRPREESTAHLLLYQLPEQLRPPRAQHVVRQRAFASQQLRLERGDEHFLADSFFLRAGDEFAVGAPDEGGTGVVGLVLAVARPRRDVAGAADLVGENGEAGVLAGAEGVLLEELVRVTAGGG